MAHPKGSHKGGETRRLEFLPSTVTLAFNFAASFQEVAYCGGGIDVEVSEEFWSERDRASFSSYR